MKKIFKSLWHAFFPPPKPVPIQYTQPTPGLVGLPFWDTFWRYCQVTNYGTHGTLFNWQLWEAAALQQAPRLRVYLQDNKPIPLSVLSLMIRYNAAFIRCANDARWEQAHIIYVSLVKEVTNARRKLPDA